MRRAVAGVWTATNERIIPALFVVSGSFLLGSLAGLIFALCSCEGDELLTAYLDQILHTVQNDMIQRPMTGSACWKCLRWLLAVIFVSGTALWLPGILAVIGLRGFFLSFSVASFARACHGLGLGIAFLLIGLPAFLAIPAFLLLGAQQFSSAWLFAGRHEYGLHWKREYQLRAAVCVGVSLLSVFLELRLCPLLLRNVSEVISSMRTF